MNSSVDVLSSHLKPLCSRDNHVMKYESGGSRKNSGQLASYHCGSAGCSVRYNSTDGYYMLIGMPSHAYSVDEPGVNTMKCPIHGRWMYRRKNIDAEPRIRWFCSVEDCHYGHDRQRKRVIGSGLSDDSRPEDAAFKSDPLTVDAPNCIYPKVRY